MGPGAPWHVGSSQTRARTRVPCISRQILNHCATREALFFKFILFIYFWLRWVFVAVRGPSLVAVSGGYSLLFWWLLLLRSTGSRHTGSSSCGMQAQ